MNNRIYGIRNCMMCLLLVAVSSCSDWLDVKPKTEEEASSLFQTEEGFKSALAGVYISLSQANLYGKELTFGMISTLGQEWGSGDPFYNRSPYDNLRNYNFENISVRSMIDQVWNGMYNTVANVNTLLQYTEEQGSVLSAENHAVIRGEALALRAFIHFDLLRMFAPYAFNGEARPAIPYVLAPEPSVYPQLTPARFMENVLRDLDAALELLKADPIVTGKDMHGVDNGYLVNRNFHLNYYAVLGLKARACLYMGNLAAASAAALEVIAAQQEKGLFPWVNPQELTTTYVNLRDRTFASEHLFALNTMKLKDFIKGYFREFNKPMSVRIKPSQLYEPDDYRKAIYETYGGVPDVLSKFWQMESMFVNGKGEVFPKRDRMPILRISEMYYIQIECLMDSNLAEAVRLLNIIRENRGLERISISGAGRLREELTKEYMREFVGEGQVYYYHKRLGTGNIDGVHGNAAYVFPMPDQEVDLGERTL